jgi:hypothetical protein
MAKSGEEVYSGSEAWNFADAYTKLKVLKQMLLADKFEMVAIYGVEDIEEEGLLPSNMIIMKRVNALYRFKDVLMQLIQNTKFSIPDGEQNRFENLRRRVKVVEELMDATHYTRFNHGDNTQEMVISEAWFNRMLRELQEVKELLNIPINRAGLIFRQSDDMTIDELQKMIEEGG